MSLRLGFDLDGVLADLNSTLVREAQRLFPGLEVRQGVESVAPAAVDPDAPEGGDPSETSPASLTLTRRQERQLWDSVRRIENFWETLDETEPGIIRRLAETARARRWEVMFLTSRPRSAGDVVQLQSQRWLRKHGFEFPSLFVVSTSRGKIAAGLELDVVVDDRPENCLDITHRLQGARDPDLARRPGGRPGKRAPARHRRRELRRRMPRSARRRRQRSQRDNARRSIEGTARHQAPRIGRRGQGARVILPIRKSQPSIDNRQSSFLNSSLPLARILPSPLRIPSQTEPESCQTEL